MTKFEFNTTSYEFSHGKQPRGRGSWAFFPNRAQRIEDAWWSPSDLTYAEAKRAFREAYANRDEALAKFQVEDAGHFAVVTVFVGS